MRKFLKITGIVLLVILLFALKTFWQSGGFKTITNSFAGTVQKIEGIAGAEDIAIDQASGVAFLSADDRWAAMVRKQPVKGAIYALNLNDSTLIPVELTAGFDQEDFHPHGISFYRSTAGKKLLFVINHRRSGNFVEIFEFRNDSLVHQETVSDDLLISPNDLVAVGTRKFYFTNDHNEKVSGWRMAKDFLSIGTGNVNYYDGEKVSPTIVEGLKYANGINVSLDGTQLYVSATTDRTIFTYNRDTVSGTVSNPVEFYTGTGVDNIDVDPEGNLWVGCHPKMLKFLSHSKNENSISPSEVIKLVRTQDGGFDQTTVYMNDGSEISASSVGVVYRKKLVIGPVFQGHFLVTTLAQ